MLFLGFLMGALFTLLFLMAFWNKIFYKYNIPPNVPQVPAETNKDYKSRKINYRRRGLYDTSYTISATSESLSVKFELGEVERTDKMSKVEVINLRASNSEYNSGVSKQKLSNMLNDSWLESCKIEWIETPLEDKRADKLKEILGNEDI